METTASNQTLKTVFTLMKFTFGLVPIAAGADKFANVLTNWENYLNPVMVQLLPFSAHAAMLIIGVIEIAAGIIVLVKPAIGGYIVAAWLALIAISLITSGKYIDVAVRDLVMAVCAFSLARLAKIVS